MFKRLTIQNWRQFQNVEIDFHDRLTILTGANASGKTTILNLLSRHYGWNIPLVSTPKRSKSGTLRYLAGLWKQLFPDKPDSSQTATTIGTITYGDEQTAQLKVPPDVKEQFKIQIDGQQNVNGLHIPSHRPVYFYQQVQQIPTRPWTRKQSFDTYANLVREQFQGGRSKAPNFTVKETLISLATFGPGNDFVTRNEDAVETFEGFQSILRIVMPDIVGFERISIEIPEVVLETRTGNFSLDAVSGGIAAIIDLSWQIYMYSHDVDRYTVTIDEPENHLHPEMQRTVLPNFLKAFPTCQFIVATHNPFIVGAMPESNVYALNFNQDHRVESCFLDLVNKAGSSNEILRDALGLEVTMPVWVEQKLAELTDKYLSGEVDKEKLLRLRSEMKQLGLENIFPATIAESLGGEIQK